MSHILDQIAASTRARVERMKARTSPADMQKRAEAARTPHFFLDAFPAPGPHVIAEVKLASPSEGDIAPGLKPIEVADSYLENGAAALSVLTEPDYFKGDLRYLEAIRARFPHAFLLMKDFLLDEYQLHVARAAGADAVLILLAMLTRPQAEALYKSAWKLGLTPLVEVHSDDEMSLALELGAQLIGINNRDLKTMQVSLHASERLAARAPRDAVLISESGIKTGADMKRLVGLGYRGFLVGTSLMKTRRPGPALAELLKGARA